MQNKNFIKNKNITQKQKTPKLIPQRIYFAIFIVLISVLGGLIVYPFIIWDEPIPILKWATLLLITVVLFSVLFYYQDLTTQKIEFNSKIKALKKENERLKRIEQNHSKIIDDLEEKYSEEIYQNGAEIQNLSAEIKELKTQKSIYQKYLATLREIYLCSSLEDTRLYASEILKHENSLNLFDPIRYSKNSKYAQVIDLYANELIAILNAPRDSWLSDNTYKVETRLNELLKNAKAGSNDGYTPVITR